MKHKIASILLAAAATLPAAAQEFRSAYFMQTSTTRHELNPALLDESFIQMPLLLGYTNIGTTGNIGLKNFVYKMDPSWQGYGVEGRTLTTFMHPSVDRGAFLGDLKDNNRLNAHVKYQLAGVAFKAFGGYNIIDLNLRVNAGLAAPKGLFAFMKDTGEEMAYDFSDLGVRTESYVELGLGHSHKLDDKWTVGGKVKLLFGLAYADFTANDFHVSRTADGDWSVSGTAELTSALMGTELKYAGPDKNYVYTDPVTGTQTVTDRRRVDGLDDFKGGLGGFGLAFDLGVTYQALPELKVSASLTDLGFISWKSHKASSSGETWTFDGFRDPIPAGGNSDDAVDLDDQWETTQDDLENLFSLYEEEGKNPKKVARALAATLNLGAEYTLPQYDKLRLGFLYTSRLAGKYSHHQGMFSATVQPVKWFEAMLNMAFTSTGVTGGLTVDFRAPRFNIFVGTDRFFGKLSKQGIPLRHGNADLALGISFPMGK